MTLVTTAGDPAADSYASLAEADAYFTSRGVETWTGTDTAKEYALRKGTTYLDNQYSDRWIGIVTTQDQSLAWPRSDGYRDPWHLTFTYPLVDVNGFQINVDAVPVQVKRACMEAALLSLTGFDLEPRITPEAYLKSIRTKVDVIEKEIQYSDGAPAIDRYSVIEGLLRTLVTSTPGSTSGNTRLVRS